MIPVPVHWLSGFGTHDAGLWSPEVVYVKQSTSEKLIGK